MAMLPRISSRFGMNVRTKETATATNRIARYRSVLPVRSMRKKSVLASA